MAIPRNARPGVRLPKIGGLRLRRKVKTGKYGIRDVIVGPGGRVYGLTAPGKFKIGMYGNDANRYLSIVNKASGGGTGGAGGTGTTPGTTSPTAPKPKPDEYAQYEKDYPWIATYLRSLKAEEDATMKRINETALPAATAGLTALGNIGKYVADSYGATVGTSPNQPGYVSNIYNVAAGMSPAQVASGLGGAATIYDPNSVAAKQGVSAAAGASAQADARYRSLMAGLSPVSTAQGILGYLHNQAMNISKTYADKRTSERTRLDMWIAEQKAGAEDRQIRQQYNMAMLGYKKEDLALDRQRLDRMGQKTNAELAADGFRKVSEVAGAGPANKAKIAATTVTSVEGEQWYKPKSGSGSGSGGPTVDQTNNFTKGLTDAYYGKAESVDPNTQALIAGIPGYRDRTGPKSWQLQANDIASYIMTGKGGLGPKTPQAVRAMLARIISRPQYKTSPNSPRYENLNMNIRKKMFDRVINLLVKQGYFG